jgi:hypothetical protein
MTMSEQTLRDAGLEELVTRIYRLCVFSLQHQHRLFANGRAVLARSAKVLMMLQSLLSLLDRRAISRAGRQYTVTTD